MKNSLPSKTSGPASHNNIEEPLYREEDFKDLITVRGEDVVISWEAIAEGDVKTLYLSLEPWGEGHILETGQLLPGTLWKAG